MARVLQRGTALLLRGLLLLLRSLLLLLQVHEQVGWDCARRGRVAAPSG